MALKSYQKELTLGNLYKVTKSAPVSGSEQINPSIFVNSGSVDIYSYNGATQPVAVADMVLSVDDTDVSAIKQIVVMPSYIYVTQSTGTSTEVVVSGIDVEDLGAIV